jgi:hypothetical protein
MTSPFSFTCPAAQSRDAARERGDLGAARRQPERLPVRAHRDDDARTIPVHARGQAAGHQPLPRLVGEGRGGPPGGNAEEAPVLLGVDRAAPVRPGEREGLRGNECAPHRIAEELARDLARRAVRLDGGEGVGRERVGHQRVGHQCVGYQCVGYQGIRHQRVGHQGIRHQRVLGYERAVRDTDLLLFLFCFTRAEVSARRGEAEEERQQESRKELLHWNPPRNTVTPRK